MAEKQIKKTIKLSTLISHYPEALEVLLKYNLPCLGCALASFESLEEGARAHGMSDQEIEALVKEINQLLKQKMEKGRD